MVVRTEKRASCRCQPPCLLPLLNHHQQQQSANETYEDGISPFRRPLPAHQLAKRRT